MKWFKFLRKRYKDFGMKNSELIEILNRAKELQSEAKCDTVYFINEIKEVSKDLEVDFKDYFKLILTLMEAEYERKFKETFKASS